jgi:hypothetical protein
MAGLGDEEPDGRLEATSGGLPWRKTKTNQPNPGSRKRSCAGDSQDAGVVEDVSLQEKWSERARPRGGRAQPWGCLTAGTSEAKTPKRGHWNRGVAALG